MQKTMRVTYDVTFNIDDSKLNPDFRPLWELLMNDPKVLRRFLAIWALTEVNCSSERKINKLAFGDEVVEEEDILEPLIRKLEPDQQQWFFKWMQETCLFLDSINPAVTRVAFKEIPTTKGTEGGEA